MKLSDLIIAGSKRAEELGVKAGRNEVFMFDEDRKLVCACALGLALLGDPEFQPFEWWMNTEDGSITESAMQELEYMTNTPRKVLESVWRMNDGKESPMAGHWEQRPQPLSVIIDFVRGYEGS